MTPVGPKMRLLAGVALPPESKQRWPQLSAPGNILPAAFLGENSSWIKNTTPLQLKLRRHLVDLTTSRHFHAVPPPRMQASFRVRVTEHVGAASAKNERFS